MNALCRRRRLLLLPSVCFIVLVLKYYLDSPKDENTSAVDSSLNVRLERQEPNATTAHVPLEVNRTTDSQVRGEISGCTLADVARRPGVMLFTSINTAFLDMALNMFQSIRRAGVCVNSTILAEDEPAFQYLRKRTQLDPAMHVLMTETSGDPSGKLKKLKWGSAVYNKFVNKRHNTLLALLEQGYEVLHCDVDTYWFRDPFPIMQGEFDLAMYDEYFYYPGRNQTLSVYCAGFIYCKPTQRTLSLVKTWVETLNKQEDKIIPDQTVLNELLQKDQPVRLEIKSLDPELFPGGFQYFKAKGWVKKHKNVHVVHVTQVWGHDNKVRRLKQRHLWRVSKSVLKTLPDRLG